MTNYYFKTILLLLLGISNTYAADSLIVHIKNVELAPYANEENTLFLGDDDFEFELTIGSKSSEGSTGRTLYKTVIDHHTIAKFIVEENETNKTVNRSLDIKQEIPIEWLNKKHLNLFLYEGEWLRSDLVGEGWAPQYIRSYDYESLLNVCVQGLVARKQSKCAFQVRSKSRVLNGFDIPDNQDFVLDIDIYLAE